MTGAASAARALVMGSAFPNVIPRALQRLCEGTLSLFPARPSGLAFAIGRSRAILQKPCVWLLKAIIPLSSIGALIFSSMCSMRSTMVSTFVRAKRLHIQYRSKKP